MPCVVAILTAVPLPPNLRPVLGSNGCTPILARQHVQGAVGVLLSKKGAQKLIKTC